MQPVWYYEEMRQEFFKRTLKTTTQKTTRQKSINEGNIRTNVQTTACEHWSRVLLEKLTSFQLVKKFPAFYGTWRFLTPLTSACHLSLSRASSVQSILPHPTSWRSILILSSHLCLGHPSGLFPSGFCTKTIYTPLLSPIHATCPLHLILLAFITQKILGEEYR